MSPSGGGGARSTGKDVTLGSDEVTEAGREEDELREVGPGPPGRPDHELGPSNTEVEEGRSEPEDLPTFLVEEAMLVETERNGPPAKCPSGGEFDLSPSRAHPAERRAWRVPGARRGHADAEHGVPLEPQFERHPKTLARPSTAVQLGRLQFTQDRAPLGEDQIERHGARRTPQERAVPIEDRAGEWVQGRTAFLRRRSEGTFAPGLLIHPGTLRDRVRICHSRAAPRCEPNRAVPR